MSVTARVWGLLLILLASPAQAAELYLDAGIGAASHIPIKESGTWWQADQPHHFDTTALAWRTGLGLRLDDHWAMQAGYLNLGTTTSFTHAVADEHFDFGAGKCFTSCERVMLNTAREPVTGWEFFGRYTWHPGWIDPYVTAGMARLTHPTYSASTAYQSDVWVPADVVLGGTLWAGRVGGGLCYQWLCGDVTYYHGLTGLDNGISERAVVSIIGLQVPLWHTE